MTRQTSSPRLSSVRSPFLWMPCAMLALFLGAACTPGEEPREEVPTIPSQGMMMPGEPGEEGEEQMMPSQDARCQGELCSGQGTCQIIAEQATCVCNAGYQARGLACEELVEGAPTLLERSHSEIRLTQGESQTITLKVRAEGDVTAKIVFVYDPTDIEEFFTFDKLDETTFALTVSWEQLDEEWGGIDFDEAFTEALTLRLEDEQGRTFDTLMPLTLHCDGAGGSACDGACVDFSSNPDHCGGCFIPTPNGASCQAGERVCDDASLVACDEACVPSNELNCGRCGNVCWDGATCDSDGGFCEFEELYEISPNTFVAPSMSVSSGYAYMIDARGGRLRGLSRVDDEPWQAAIAPVAPSDHVLSQTFSNGLGDHLVVDAEILEGQDLNRSYAYMLQDPRDSMDNPRQTTGKVYVYDFTEETLEWSAPVELPGPPAQMFVHTSGTLRLFKDRQGTHRVAYRSTQGIEFFSRDRVGEPWVKQPSLAYDFFEFDGSASTSFGYVYDTLHATHHVVFADGVTYFHAQRTDQESTWQLQQLASSDRKIATTEVSKMYQGPDGGLHVMYGVSDQLVYQVYDPFLKAWQQPVTLTPTTHQGADLDYSPRPEGFVMDSTGNRWVLTVVGQIKTLLSAPAGQVFWTSDFISGGMEYVYAYEPTVVPAPQADGGVNLHLLSQDLFMPRGSAFQYQWQYKVHAY